MPRNALDQIEEFVNTFYKEVTAIPDIDDGEKHKITVSCILDIGNVSEINEEIQKITSALLS